MSNFVIILFGLAFLSGLTGNVILIRRFYLTSKLSEAPPDANNQDGVYDYRPDPSYTDVTVAIMLISIAVVLALLALRRIGVPPL